MLYFKLKDEMSDEFKSLVKSFLSRLSGPYNYSGISDGYGSPGVDREGWHLQKTKNKLPTSKFAKKFEYTPKISFADGILRTVSWLQFTGYLDHLNKSNSSL